MPKKKSKKEIKQLIALEWPSALAFGTILPDYMITEDPNFTREKTGVGSIEYFNEPYINYGTEENPNIILNPNGEIPTLLYDPNTNTADDVKLDLLHHYRLYDPVYLELLNDYEQSLQPEKNDILWNSLLGDIFRERYNNDALEFSKHWDEWDTMVNTTPSNSLFMLQGVDGSLRNLLANDETIENSNYLPREDAEKQWLSTPKARKAFDNIKLYLTTYRLPEVTVTGHKHEDGGALSWEELPMKDRHYYILQGVALGLRDIDSIKESYNLYALGGNIYATKGVLKKGSNTPKGDKQRFIELLDKKLADSRYAYFNTPLWRNYFISLVNKESGYNPKAVNKDTGASGYFLIMPQYKWYKNDEELFDLVFLMTKANLDLIRKSLTKQDLRNLEAMGYDIYGIAGGAHLGGANGLLNFIKRGTNAQDANHSSVKDYVSSFSLSPKRNMSDTNQQSLLDFSADTTGYTDLIVTVPDDEVPQQKPIIIEEVPEEPQLPLLTIPVVPTTVVSTPVLGTGNSFLLPTLFLSLINLGLLEDPLTYSPKVNTVDIPITATDILKKQKLKLQQKYLDDVDNRYIKNIINSTYLDNAFADGGTKETFLSKLYPSTLAKRLQESMIINGGTLPEVAVIGDKMKSINNRLNNLYSSSSVNPTDNTWAEPTNILLQNEKVLNPQLLKEAVEGAMKYNAWRENHPYMAIAGDIASTIPVATAAYPIVSPVGSGIATALTNPYVQAGINSYFAAEGVDDIINGRANWSTPINFLPFYGGATKTLTNAVGKAYNSGKKAYDTTRLAIGLNNDIRNFGSRRFDGGGDTENQQSRWNTTSGTGYVPPAPTQDFVDNFFYKVSSKIMQLGRGTSGNIPVGKHGEPMESVAQGTYLLPRSIQERIFKKYGYTKVDGDYGLVKKAVGNRNIPVYQRNPDSITRDQLHVIGNPSSGSWFGSVDTGLVHAGKFPSAVYHDDNGYLYQKAWDLNDYGGNHGAAKHYSTIKGLAADFVDAVGSPTVVTTGFQPIVTRNGSHATLLNTDNRDSDLDLAYLVSDYLKSKGLVKYPASIATYEELERGMPAMFPAFIGLPEVTVVGKRKKRK